jgi:heme exporter protein C
MRRFYRLLSALGSVRAQRILGWATWLGLLVTAVVALAVVPADADQGDVQRLMYVHVPAAWVAFLSFGVVFLASVGYLKTGRIHWDRIAVSSAEIGVVFCALTIVLGSLWGRPVWGTWWTWDPRLTTTALLLLIYAGYLSLRKVADSPARRARWSAVSAWSASSTCRSCTCRWSGGGRCTSRRPCCGRARRRSPAACWRPCCWRSSSFSVTYGYLMAVRLRVGRLEERGAVPVSAPRARRPQPAVAPAGGVTNA